jgi:hypothetical protein
VKALVIWSTHMQNFNVYSPFFYLNHWDRRICCFLNLHIYFHILSIWTIHHCIIKDFSCYVPNLCFTFWHLTFLILVSNCRVKNKCKMENLCWKSIWFPECRGSGLKSTFLAHLTKKWSRWGIEMGLCPVSSIVNFEVKTLAVTVLVWS